MSRYIDRDAVRRAIQEYCFSPYEMTPDGIAKVVMNVPPADVEEVRHGEWKKVNDKYPRYVCTSCNHLYNNIEYKFCPNCGADMRGKNNGRE